MAKKKNKARAGKPYTALEPPMPMVREVAAAPALEPELAKLFWNGRSQAVRLPKAFRFEGDAVYVRRSGDAVILEPLRRRGWPAGFWEWLDESPKDWLDRVERLDVKLREPSFGP